MAGQMWMGTRGREMWVPAPATGAEFTPVGFAARANYLNGGVGVNRSVATHMEYNMVWNVSSRAKLRPIGDMHSGIHGQGLIYFVDPMAADQNVLPQMWAFPAQACYDAIPLAGDVRPANVQTPANTLGYPAESARYRIVSGTETRSIYLPIPPGFVAWVGVHGVSNGGEVVVTANGADVRLPMMSVTDPDRFSNMFTGTGIDLRLVRDISTTAAAYPSTTSYPATSTYASDGISDYMTISGMMVQILPAGVTPERGGFISGQGNSGCKFDGPPLVTAYSAALDQIGASAKLVEAGSWL